MTRLFDRGAVFAGYVGLGMAIVIVLAFELIIPVQAIVFIAAPLAGILIGVYANVRSERWRPRGRVLLNAGWAGLVTGVGLALVYVAIRFLFIYGDSGFPIFNRVDPNTHQPIPPFCDPGPDCYYQRLVANGLSDEFTAEGIVDGPTAVAGAARDLTGSGAALVLLTLGGAVIGGVGRTFSKRPTSAPLPKAATAE